MKSIDIKSLLIGILGTALVMVLMGQSSVRNQYDIECFLDYAYGAEQFVCKRFNLNGAGWNQSQGVEVFDSRDFEKMGITIMEGPFDKSYNDNFDSSGKVRFYDTNY